MNRSDDGFNIHGTGCFIRHFSIYDKVTEIIIIVVINYYFVVNVAKNLRF